MLKWQEHKSPACRQDTLGGGPVETAGIQPWTLMVNVFGEIQDKAFTCFDTSIHGNWMELKVENSFCRNEEL